MFTYIKNISVVMALLSAAALALAYGLEGYDAVLGIGAVVFMGLNALAAVYPLYRFRGKNPFQIYLLGMVIRLAVIGAALIALVTLGGHTRNALLAFTLTAMVAYVAYMVVEIRHFIRQNLGDRAGQLSH